MDKAVLLIPVSHADLGWVGGYEASTHDTYTKAKTPGTLDLSFKLEGLMTVSPRSIIHSLPTRKATIQCRLVWLCVHIS